MRNQWIIYAYVSLITAWLIVSLIKLFPSILLEIYELASAEEYSYLYALILVIVFIFIKRIKTIEPPSTSSVVYGIIVSSLGLSSSLYLYSISFGIAEWYWVRIIALSFWIIGVTILALGLDNASKLKIPLLALFLLIPIPRTIIDSTAITLSKILGRVAAPLVGAKISESATGLTVLSVIGPEGRPIHFEIAVGCSGIVSLTSIIAVLPIIADILSSTKTTFRRKIYALIVSTTTLAIIMLFGNLLRIMGILIAAKYMGQQAAMEFFHSTPSIIFAIMASVIVVLLLNKLLGRQAIKGKASNNTFYGSSRSNVTLYRGMIISLILVVLVVLFFSNINAMNFISPKEAGKSSNNLVDVNILLQNSSFYIVKDDAILRFRSLIERKDWERLLGIPLVIVSQVRYNKTNMLMYIEASGSPHLFHNWPVCLAYQGYTIDKSWIESVKIDNKSIEIIFVVYRRGNVLYMMGYTKIAVMADYGGVMSPVYYKITLLSSSSVNYDIIYRYYRTITDALKYYLKIIDTKVGIISTEEQVKYHFMQFNPVTLLLLFSMGANGILVSMILFNIIKSKRVLIRSTSG